MGHDPATLRQIAAARPDRSTWLSANAGSGKTKVLTDRVARLLLDGVDPQNILCLTYTKAAASEMQNRLFKRLGAWAMLPRSELEMQLRDLGHEARYDQETLSTARRLFASAIETPGGLKIQTIHSFCSALLRRFPFEAGVTPNFSEMEERDAALLQTEILEELADGPHQDLLYSVARLAGGESLGKLAGQVVRSAPAFRASSGEAGLSAMLGVPSGLTEGEVLRGVFRGSEIGLIKAVADGLKSGGATDSKAALKLSSVATSDLSALEALEDIFLFKSGKKQGLAKIGSFPTKAGQKMIASHMAELDALMLRVEAAKPQRLSLLSLQRTRALCRFADVFIAAYEAAKQARGWLDFDDLILRTRDLLKDPRVADWVLYKLDGRIDHILVDEAQDTSPVQWQVIECLAREFTSGEGIKPDEPRTVFVVGDKKQSIYSFQGADPREFDRMKEEFRARLQNTLLPLQDLIMEYSFRSAPAVLRLVDRAFQDKAESGFGAEQAHIAFKDTLPGRVDLWPVVEPPEKPDDPIWYEPVDIKTPDDPNSILAREIARFIEATLGTPLPDGTPGSGRRVEPGDFLILVRRRAAIFHDVIRECKARGLPVAGADRLKVGAELAVKDIQALLSYLVTPEDDLALATALRSPLFGWSEAELYDLAQGRAQSYLSAELRDRAEAFPETVAVLDDLREQVDFLRPYDLIDRILTRHDGRRRLLGRLGPEAQDGIDALLAQALAYERNAVDSLTGFLVWMETDELEIKRQLDNAGNRIRVMTVHGAKGLEAPIVILPDCAQRRAQPRGDLAFPENGVLWRSRADEATEMQVQLDQASIAAEQAEQDRLLYVAMTRAEQWLIVAAAGDLGRDGSSWHDQTRTALEGLQAQPLISGLGQGLRYESGDWSGTGAEDELAEEEAALELPSSFLAPVPPVVPVETTLSPSDLGGAKALPDERGLDEEAAKRRGRQIHRLLEVLPDVPMSDHGAVAARLLSFGSEKAEKDELSFLLAEVQNVLSKPGLAELFAQDALIEVPISANLAELGGRRIHGVIDRLVLRPDQVLAVDFKTNALPPERAELCPDGLLRQMGAYAQALAQIYPDRPVRTALLWTRTATLMQLPHDLVTDALRNTRIP